MPQPEVPLSPALRARVVAWASRALDALPASQLPPALRKTAGFAPTKRAKLLAAALESAIETDDAFRESVGIQVRALAAGTPADPDAERLDDVEDRRAALDAAAVAYLARPEGWLDLVAAAQRLDDPPSPSNTEQLEATVDRLRDELAAARAETASVRTRLREQVDRLKADNAALRRSLGQARAELRAAADEASRAAQASEDARRQAEDAVRSAEAEGRRLRHRVDQLESETAAVRRAARDDRGAENVRLRLLLDAVTESAAGLRRELALPPTELLPADTVATMKPPPLPQGSRVGRALLDDDPVLLRHLLELPRTHLIIDGYNVTKTAWPTAPLEQQRTRLATGVGALVAGRSVETTIVFDGAEVGQPPATPAPRGVRVRFSPPGVIADDVIRALVDAEQEGRPLVVVSTDRELADSVAKKGARAVAAQALVAALP